MRDLIILIGIYVSALLLAGFGIVSLRRQKNPPEAQDKPMPKKPLVSTEDMLSGWGKEEEEAKQ
jgi:flagellar basal body-associated protein FliL